MSILASAYKTIEEYKDAVSCLLALGRNLEKAENMEIIFSILRSAHCRSTHHYFAIDALKQLPTASAQRLGHLLLKYHDEYLDGAKAPDSRFKDYQNHVIHVSDNYWGGAADKCKEWLELALQHLNAGRWKHAAYACGILSHYFTDPIMPLHTGQSPEEAELHRPIEWSVFKSYTEIYQLAQHHHSAAQFQFASDPNWIGKAVHALAQISHQQYRPIIENYNLTSANEPPYYGLNEQSRNIFASLFTLAIDGWSAVLTRLADETKSDLPLVSLGLPSILATVDMPLAWIVRRISNLGEQRAVAAAIREFERTGHVVRHVAEETKSVSKAKASKPLPAGVANLSIKNEVVASNDLPSSEQTSKVTTDELIQNAQAECHEQRNSSDSEVTTPPDFQGPITEQTNTERPVFLSLAEARARMKGLSPLPNELAIEPASTDHQMTPSETQQPDSTVSLTSPLVQAPSIGPKTAKRFEKIGIRTIEQFLAENPEELESRLQTRWITATVIGQWQDQTRLVCEVPILTGYRAQLLVAVGCRNAWQLRTANANQLATQLSNFCETSEGKKILQSARTPTVNDVTAWIDSARKHARRMAA